MKAGSSSCPLPPTASRPPHQSQGRGQRHHGVWGQPRGDLAERGHGHCQSWVPLLPEVWLVSHCHPPLQVKAPPQLHWPGCNYDSQPTNISRGKLSWTDLLFNITNKITKIKCSLFSGMVKSQDGFMSLIEIPWSYLDFWTWRGWESLSDKTLITFMFYHFRLCLRTSVKCIALTCLGGVIFSDLSTS